MAYAVPVNGNRMVYGGHLMRSNLEVNLAIMLDAHRVTWQYEAEEIALPDGRRYHPDFTITEDRAGITDGVQIIEVKDKKHVWRCAQTLGLGARGSDEENWLWTAPKHAKEHDRSGQYWAALNKPVQAALSGRRVLVIGATTQNAAVILMGAGGLMSAKRHHSLMSRVYRHVTIEGSVQAPRVDALEAMEHLRRQDRLGLGRDSVWVHHAVMRMELTRIRDILEAAQNEELEAVA